MGVTLFDNDNIEDVVAYHGNRFVCEKLADEWNEEDKYDPETMCWKYWVIEVPRVYIVNGDYKGRS